MRLRPTLAVLAVAALAIAGGLYLATPQQARAVPSEETPAGLPQVIYDQQDVTTDPGGRVTLDFREGDRVQSCLAGPARYVGIAPARNLTDPGNGPVSFQAVQQTACDVLLRIFNDSDDPISGAVIRLTYTASAATTLGGEGGEPAPEPEPEPTPDPDPEPGPSLLIAAGGATLPQGVTPIGEVDTGAYSAVVPEGVNCYAALLSGSDTIHDVITNELVRGPANATFEVPAENDEVKFVHVDCAE